MVVANVERRTSPGRNPQPTHPLPDPNPLPEQEKAADSPINLHSLHNVVSPARTGRPPIRSCSLRPGPGMRHVVRTYIRRRAFLERRSPLRRRCGLECLRKVIGIGGPRPVGRGCCQGGRGGGLVNACGGGDGQGQRGRNTQKRGAKGTIWYIDARPRT